MPASIAGSHLPTDDVEHSGQQLPISSSARQNGDSERRDTAQSDGKRQQAKVIGHQVRQKNGRPGPCDECRHCQK
jgi:hypothetical protein